MSKNREIDLENRLCLACVGLPYGMVLRLLLSQRHLCSTIVFLPVVGTRRDERPINGWHRLSGGCIRHVGDTHETLLRGDYFAPHMLGDKRGRGSHCRASHALKAC